METSRRWVSTGLRLPVLSFGASSLGQEFRSVKLDEALESVRVALDCGLNFIDTSPFYGRGMSEVLLGIALRGVPRESLHALHQARPLRPRAFRFLRPAGGRERGREPAPPRHRPPRHRALPRHRVRPHAADRRRDHSRPAPGPAGGQGALHRLQRLPAEDLPLHPRPDPGRLRAELQPVHAAEHPLRGGDHPVPQGQGRGRDERRPVQRAPADQRPAARLAQGARGGQGGRPRRRRSSARPAAWTSPKLALQFSLRSSRHHHHHLPAAPTRSNIRNWAAVGGPADRPGAAAPRSRPSSPP
jgi:hypothetical protein